MSRIGSGIWIVRSVATSCAISAIGNSGSRSAGPTGCRVPGCSTGSGGRGRSATMLYHSFGSRLSSSRYFTVSDIAFPICRTRNSVGRKSAAYSAGLLDFHDVLREDHFLVADAGGVGGRGEVPREYPDAVERAGDDLRGRAVVEHDPSAGAEQADVDRFAHSAARATRQVASSSQLSASINSAQRRKRLRKVCSPDLASVTSMTVPG